LSVEDHTCGSLGETGVSVEQLISEHLDIWTGADTEKKSGRGRSSGSAGSVHGIKKLRELILELAVRGKLVPQDANDEPASELLKRIAVEKARLILDGKIKKDKSLAVITDEEKPFELPQGWEWVRLGEIAEIVRGVTYGKSDASDNSLPDYVPLLRGNNIDRILNFDRPVFVPKRLLNEGQFVKAGDIVIAMSSGSADLVGKAAQATEDFSGGFGAFCGVVRSVSDEVFSFFGFFFQTPLYRIRAAGHGKGIGINNLQKTALQTLEVPLAPLAEQHRIVAKVDELMALCDQLENQHNNAAEAHEKLVTHLLGTLTQSQNAEDFNINWQRISEHFDTLFTTEASIDALKQTLLQLAVIGKLVPQDPNDEPASELLKRIQAEKTKLIAEGKIKKDKPLAEITDEEKPFDLPVGWEWVRLGNISQLKGGMAYQSTAFVETGKNQVIRMGNVRPWRLRIDEKAVFIDDSLADKTMEYSLNIDDIVITMTGTIGKRDYVYSARIHENDVQNKKLFLNQRLCSVRPYFVKPLYLDMAMKDDRLLDVIFSNATGTANQANISMSSLNLWLIPTPPINEQHRIVAKVDVLMAICDQLKVRIIAANQLQQKLANVMVEQATT
jgi:type I restriction enzyme, S subunit